MQGSNQKSRSLGEEKLAASTATPMKCWPFCDGFESPTIYGLPDIREMGALRSRCHLCLSEYLSEHDTDILNLGSDFITCGGIRSLVYQPLKSPNAIRLVTIKSGTRYSPLECSVSEQLLDDQPYEALSYEWMDSDPDTSIISVNETHLRIRANLYWALGSIRLETQDRRVWIDALSIDQANTEERGHQVKMMREIYAKASRVLVWLGPADRNSDVLFRKRLPLEYSFEYSFDDAANETRRVELEALSAMVNRSYWHRVWIQQELLLATKYTLFCGDGTLTDVAFQEVASQVPELQQETMYRTTTRPPLARYASIRTSHAFHIMATKDRKTSIPSLTRLGAQIQMSMRADLQTSEPRDFVYAMLGISSDCQNGEIVPDYNKPMLDVYMEVLKHCKAQSISKTFQRTLAEKLGLDFDAEMQERVAQHLATE